MLKCFHLFLEDALAILVEQRTWIPKEFGSHPGHPKINSKIPSVFNGSRFSPLFCYCCSHFCIFVKKHSLIRHLWLPKSNHMGYKVSAKTFYSFYDYHKVWGESAGGAFKKRAQYTQLNRLLNCNSAGNRMCPSFILQEPNLTEEQFGSSRSRTKLMVYHLKTQLFNRFSPLKWRYNTMPYLTKAFYYPDSSLF